MEVAPRKVRLVDVSGERDPLVHRLLQADGTPSTKGRRSLATMLGLPESAVCAVDLFDSKEATCGVHAADTLGDPSKIDDTYERDGDTVTLYYRYKPAAAAAATPMLQSGSRGATSTSCSHPSAARSSSKGRARTNANDDTTAPNEVVADLKLRLQATMARATDGSFIQISDKENFWGTAFTAVVKQVVVDFKPRYPLILETALRNKGTLFMRNVNTGIAQMVDNKKTTYTTAWQEKQMAEAVTWFNKYGDWYRRRREGVLPKDDPYFGTVQQAAAPPAQLLRPPHGAEPAPRPLQPPRPQGVGAAAADAAAAAQAVDGCLVPPPVARRSISSDVLAMISNLHAGVKTSAAGYVGSADEAMMARGRTGRGGGNVGRGRGRGRGRSRGRSHGDDHGAGSADNSQDEGGTSPVRSRRGRRGTGVHLAGGVSQRGRQRHPNRTFCDYPASNFAASGGEGPSSAHEQPGAPTVQLDGLASAAGQQKRPRQVLDSAAAAAVAAKALAAARAARQQEEYDEYEDEFESGEDTEVDEFEEDSE